MTLRRFLARATGLAVLAGATIAAGLIAGGTLFLWAIGANS